MVKLLREIIISSEKAESTLAYEIGSKDENHRKETGSYYTPYDVAHLFWNQFNYSYDLLNKCKKDEFICNAVFIEPSAGAGILIFSMLKFLLDNGLSVNSVLKLNFLIIDINDRSIEWVKEKFKYIFDKLGLKFSNIEYKCGDYINLSIVTNIKYKIYFGNPPFISNENGNFYKNIFADFLEKSLSNCDNDLVIQFILPLSLSFSRDYLGLREKLFSINRTIYISHYDNIPDSLFKSGKKFQSNTNKSNSQRCSIITIYNSHERKLLSTSLQRWDSNSRKEFLKTLPNYHDVTEYKFDMQIPRPCSQNILTYLNVADKGNTLRSLLNDKGKHCLSIGILARNFIPFKDNTEDNSHKFFFDESVDKYKFLYIVASPIFFEYWRSLGDGFHLTRGNILNFPVSENLFMGAYCMKDYAESIWKHRKRFIKSKMNAGKLVISYDFSRAFINCIKSTDFLY